MASSAVPTVDLSPFFTEGNEDGKNMATKMISEACSEYGFFQVVNHGVPVDLMSRSIKLSKEFFETPDKENPNSSPGPVGPIRAGYHKQPEHSRDKNEYLVMSPPGSDLNVYHKTQPEFQEVLEEMFKHLARTGLLIESILNECLGLPPNFLREYNHDRTWDVLVALHYFPATDCENTGICEHEDQNCITFVFQDDVGGLEVRRDGEWIPVIPEEGKIVVNVGDVIQVLSNNKFKSATHRVVRPNGKNRYSFGFFHNLQGDKWVEPLPQFTKEIGEPPKYRGFLYKDYQELRRRNKTHPPSSPQDVVHITHYAIPST